ncbi:Cell division cycle protein 27 -like protein [Caligus rogercresseyi]|uniref:Cell division cycle protein 27 -like protein n=1 Tax=Caligus rogercresseyi TaxID=217165 RepID=A0A7T8KKU2_CALRO|nr:Cell division cycle protein 27 -like protein [Caligus rogercresseyi]
MLVQEPVQAAIWHCLNHYAYGDATFLAEKLLSEVDSDESAFLLATCYYRSGEGPSLTGESLPHGPLLRGPQPAPGGRDHPQRGLLDPRRERSQEEFLVDFGDASCFAYQVLSSLYAQTERLAKARETERKALKLNPLLWKSFQSLCLKGDNPDPGKIFSVQHLENLHHIHGNNSLLNLINASPSPTGDNGTHAHANINTTTSHTHHIHQTPLQHNLLQSPAVVPPISVTPFTGGDASPIISLGETHDKELSSNK